MKKVLLSLLITMSMIGAISCAGGKPHWGYTGQAGPENWGELDPEFEICGSGKNQSPINLTNFIKAELDPIQFNYISNATDILNNGHTIKVNYSGGSTISVRDMSFELKQFHFHSPSENQINGKSFPMEGHFVHSDKNGNLAVVAVMFEIGKPNMAMGKLWQQMPEKAGRKNKLNSIVNAEELMPNDKSYYQFNGSLTTPPCSEGVLWVVLKQPVTVSKEQNELFEHVMHHPNNRPVQPTNARPVLK